MKASRPLLALAGAAVAVGLAFWLLRTPGAPLTGPEGVPRDETRSAPAPAPAPAVSPHDTPGPVPLPAGRGAVTGTLAIPAPPGSPAPRATLVVLREGVEVARAEEGTGPFRLEYSRETGDAAPFVLRAEAPRRAAVSVPLPLRESDAGEIRLLAGLTYGGRLVDAANRPAEGVSVDLVVNSLVVASSPPSAADGAFLLSLPADANLQGLHGGEAVGWGAPPYLEPRQRGRLFLKTDTSPAGLAGTHEVVLEERPVSIRLLFHDEATGAPVAAAPVSLWCGLDFGQTLAPLAPFDATVTDESGLASPFWPMARPKALVRIAGPGGRAWWTFLARSDAEGRVPRELTLPKEPREVAVRVVEDAGGKPIPGAAVVLGTNAGLPLVGTTDAAGEIRWALFPNEGFDPEPLGVAGWSVAWRDGAGNPRREMDAGYEGPPPSGDEEAVPPLFAAPLVLRVGRGAPQGLWVRADAPAGAEPFQPRVIRAGMAGTGYFLIASRPSGPMADAQGRSVWWFWDAWMDDVAAANMPKTGTFPVELIGPGRDPLVARSDHASWLAAHRVEGALVFTAAPRDVMARSLLVTGPDGKPVAGALVAVISGTDGTNIAYEMKERERAVTGGDGRAALAALDPGGNCRVAVWDPATGNSGILRGPDVAAPPEAWRLALDPPREFRVRVKFAGGAANDTPMVVLSSVSSAFPSPGTAPSRDGYVTLRAVPLAICTVSVSALGTAVGPRGEREYRTFEGPAADVAGKDLLLEKRR